MSLDASNRMLLPKRLLDHAGIDDEVVLAGQAGRIELWPINTYPGVSTADDDFAKMAEKILGGSSSEIE